MVRSSHLKYAEGEVEEGGEGSVSDIGLCIHVQVLISDFDRWQINPNPVIEIHPTTQAESIN